MDEHAFWTVIPDSGYSMLFHERVDSAVDRISAPSDEAIVGFEHRLRALQGRAYRWNLWAAGYLAMGGMSDDSFLDFRTWLILQGRSTYEAVLADPDVLVDLSWDEEEEDFAIAERFAYVSHEIWQERHGTDLPLSSDEPEELPEPAGEPFPEDDDEWFRAHLPHLSAIHLPG